MIRFLIRLSQPFRYWLDRVSYTTKRFESLKQYKNRYQGQTVFVVGNGPSLNKTPLEDFQSYPSIGMNKIDLIFSRSAWRPSVIVVENNLVVKQHAAALLSTGIPSFISWKARHFIPWSLRSAFNYYLSSRDNAFSLEPHEGIGTSGTVTYAALQLAYYFGAKTVILLGIDHNFVNVEQSKALDYELRKGEDLNHFDPNYFRENSFWGIPDLAASEQGYRLAKVAFEADGREILDATVEGKLSVFRKISLSEVRERLALEVK